MSLASELKKLKVVKKGNFVLKSGKTSNYYIDIKKAFGDPRAFRMIVDELCEIIDLVKRSGRHGASKKATCVAGSGYGGLPLASAVALKLNLPLVMVRDKAKKHGVSKMIDGYIPTKKDRVVIIDDVFTTGTCISNICKILKPTKVNILAGCVIISRVDKPTLPSGLVSLINIDKLI